MGRFVPYEHRWDGPEDGPMPKLFGIPRLAEIVPERWASVVAGLSLRERNQVLQCSGAIQPREAGAVQELLDALPPAPDAAALQAVRAGGPLPIGVVARRENARQVNVRLGRAAYDQLDAAAHIVGTTPTTLARMLILGGVRKVLAEHGKLFSAVFED